MDIKTIAIGSDHGGFPMKSEIIPFIESMKIEVKDVGCFNTESCDYPDFAEKVCNLVVSKEVDLGVLICSTGTGMSIAANKVKGIKCALVHDHFTAKMSRKHNDANVVAFGGKVIGIEVAKEIIEAFFTNSFEGDRHSRRVNKINQIEEKQKQKQN
ncbi:ribose 5-phosphate isomerase-related [Anaeramoeba ignava]|uniref:Ribose 5-phosphate isomerase-related n=1 Tax=Anaeramoeba ignava TaxID=1746090 RepID=A0A9Q0R8M3_ANAIG|nr:ribose 5-phosphate isomerase-related [Anaeramoeba ignava]